MWCRVEGTHWHTTWSDTEHWMFLVKRTNGVCDLWANMVIVFQNKLFFSKENNVFVIFGLDCRLHLWYTWAPWWWQELQISTWRPEIKPPAILVSKRPHCLSIVTFVRLHSGLTSLLIISMLLGRSCTRNIYPASTFYPEGQHHLKLLWDRGWK